MGTPNSAFTIEDEHRPNVHTYRLLCGDRIIARDVSAQFLHLLASAGLLLAACEAARPEIVASAEAYQDIGLADLIDQIANAIASAKGAQE